MYICLCNPFTDKDVSEHLSESGKTRVKEVYSACSGGESMNCGSCACTLQSMVDKHNNTITIDALSQEMQKCKNKAKETV